MILSPLSRCPFLLNHNSIELHERSSRVDQTTLSAYTAELLEYEQRKHSEERKKGGRDL
jgi:hypothetical protein